MHFYWAFHNSAFLQSNFTTKVHIKTDAQTENYEIYGTIRPHGIIAHFCHEKKIRYELIS